MDPANSESWDLVCLAAGAELETEEEEEEEERLGAELAVDEDSGLTETDSSLSFSTAS